MGQSLFDDVFTWYEHSNVGLRPVREAPAADESERPAVQLSAVGGELAAAANGSPRGRKSTGPSNSASSRSCLTWRARPRIGERTSTASRSTGCGARLASAPACRSGASIPPSTANLFNVHGLAHKVVFNAEFSAADSNRDLTPAAALRSVGRRFGRGLPPALPYRHVRNSLVFAAAVSAGHAVAALGRSLTNDSTPCGAACKTGSARRAPKLPTI